MRGPVTSRVIVSRRMAMFCTSLATATGAWFIQAGSDTVAAQTVLPQGGSVVSGQARIGTPSGNGLTVVQNSSRAIVDWNSFSVGGNGSVNFIQPNASSAILNRVTGSTQSTIAGEVRGNGQVFLVNPNGIAITPSGSVQVGGGFVGSTLDVGNADFNAGRLNFAGKGASAGVGNAGVISSAPGGFVGLIGGSVSNSGTINVPLGKVGLGSGEQATINPTGDGFLQIAVPTGAVAADGRALIDVAGRIRAAGGTVEIKAATAQQAIRDAVNISGSLSARSVSGRSGNIVLGGGAGGNVAVSGKLSATGGGRHAGGTIVVTGRNVRLTSSARLNASGTSGGNILVGGDLRGGLDLSVKLVQGTVATARTTVVDQGAVISANGTTGAGGNAVVWSDISTDFRGTITATGAGSGTGGAVEVSSHGVLGYHGFVDVRSASGKTGTLLLDPYNVTISSAADSNMSGAGSPFSPTGNSSVLSVTTLQNALASANVTVNTGGGGAQNGDITVANAVTWASGNALTLNAAGAVTVNAAITASNGGGLTMTGSSIAVNSSAISLGGNLSATATASGSSTAVILDNATISVGSGASSISGTSVTGYGVNFTGATSLTAGSGGTLTIGGTNTAGGAVLAATIFSANAGLTTAGSVTLNGTSSSFVGLELAGGNALTVSSGNLTLNGSATSDSGLQLRGTDTLTNSGAGLLSLVGSSSSSRGAEIFSSANVTFAGNTSLSGTSATGTGTIFNNASSTTVTSGNLTVAGLSSSTSGTGSTLGTRFAAASLTNSGSGTVAVTGTSNDNGAANSGSAGVLVTGTSALTNSGAGTLSVNGVNTSGYGFQLKSAAALTTSGTVSIAGTTGTGYGFMTSAASITSTGALTVNGTSNSLVGLLLNGGVSLTDSSGSMTLNGTSSTSNAGLQLRGTDTFTNSGAGLLSLNGSSSSYRGAEIFASAHLTFTGNASLSGTAATGIGVLLGTSSVTSVASGNLTVSGTSSSTSGSGATLGTLFSDASLTNSGSGAVNVTGTSQDAGTANSGSAGLIFQGANALTNSGAGTLSASGLNTSGYGAQIKSAATLATAGTMSIAGTSNTGYGLYFGGTNTMTASSGNLTLSGNSTSNLGMELLGTSSITNNGTGMLALSATGAADLQASLSSSSGTLKLSGTGSFSQVGGAVTAGSLLLAGAGGAFTMNASGNSIGTIAANVGSLALTDGSALTVGTVAGTSGVTATSSATLVTSGNLTLASGAPVSAASPVLAAAGAFINNAGTAAVMATSGRWLIYSSAPGSDTFGALDSTNTALWNATYASLPPGSVTATGNRYLFANQPTLTVTSTNASKTYGTDDSASIASNYTVNGYQSGVANAYLADSSATAYGGAPSITSTGAGATATVAGNPYTISAALGSLASTAGYAFVFQSNGQLTVNPKALTVTANDAAKTYGSTLTFAGTEFSTGGLVNGDSVTSASLASAGAVATTGVAGNPYAITASGASGSGLSNYTISYVNGALTVTPKALTVTANDTSKTYGSTLSFAGTEFSTGGLVNGDTVTSASLASAGAVATAGVAGSPYAITASGASGSGLSNYTISYVNGALTVNPASVSVTALGGSSTVGASPANPGLSATGLQNGESESVLTGLRNSFGVTGASRTDSYTLSVAGSLTNANYVVTGTGNGTWTVTPLRAALLDGSSPSIPGLSVKPPQNEISLDVLNGLRSASDAVNTGAIANSTSPWTRSVSPAPTVSSPVGVPAVNPWLVPNVAPAPNGADVPATTPRVDASSNAATTSSPVAESACAGDSAAGNADHSSRGPSQGCGGKASKNSAGLRHARGAADRDLGPRRDGDVGWDRYARDLHGRPAARD